jgi:ComF family protein
LCARCGAPGAAVSCACPDLPQGVDWLRSLGPYDGSLRAILHALKYDGRQTLARPLGAAAVALLRGAPAEPPTLIVPVPLHPAKAILRGFNQADLIARALEGPCPVRDVLVRVQAAATQTRFSRDARRDNVAHAFALRRSPIGRLPVRLTGAHAVLVDDVVTTGATLAACAATLRAAGVDRVGAVTMARTERHGHPHAGCAEVAEGDHAETRRAINGAPHALRLRVTWRDSPRLVNLTSAEMPTVTAFEQPGARLIPDRRKTP